MASHFWARGTRNTESKTIFDCCTGALVESQHKDKFVMSSPHVLIFPLPLQGPVNCMLKLAKLLCSHGGIEITFANTNHIQRRLEDCNGYGHDSGGGSYGGPGFHFVTVPDGMPEESPRTAEQLPRMLPLLEAAAVPILREMLRCTESGKQISCLIADGFFSFVADVARETGVPLLYFDTISPCGFWTYLCLEKLIQAGEVPFKDDNLDEMIDLPGMEGLLRRRDLPSFYRTRDLHNDPIVQLILKEASHIPLSQGLIFNTFQQLEAPVLSQLLTISPNIYSIGPLHSHLKSRLPSQPTISNSIWKEDKSCIPWLDAQPSKSVIYVSIGSLAVMTRDHMLEIWYGLVNSGSRFLWVQRPGSISGTDGEYKAPSELLEGTERRGYIVSWAPQEEVLAHPAVGCFLTHSGWNSTLESIVEGKPMICWPYFVDQHVNSRYVGEVWKVGLDMKDICDRDVVEEMIREVMVVRKDEFIERANEMAKWARASVSVGGSSFSDLDRLVRDIKAMEGKNRQQKILEVTCAKVGNLD